MANKTTCYTLSGSFGTIHYNASSFAEAYRHAKKLAQGGQVVVVCFS